MSYSPRLVGGVLDGLDRDFVVGAGHEEVREVGLAHVAAQQPRAAVHERDDVAGEGTLPHLK